MLEIRNEELEEITRRVDREFPNDPALRQVHIARKIIAREAELNGMSYLEYVGRLAKEAHESALGSSS